MDKRKTKSLHKTTAVVKIPKIIVGKHLLHIEDEKEERSLPLAELENQSKPLLTEPQNHQDRISKSSLVKPENDQEDISTSLLAKSQEDQGNISKYSLAEPQDDKNISKSLLGQPQKDEEDIRKSPFTETSDDITIDGKNEDEFELDNRYGAFPYAPDFGPNNIQNTNQENLPDVNVYQHKKTVAQGMMDLALFSANANQLRYVVESPNHPYFYPGVTLIVFSLFCQVAVGAGLLWNTKYDIKDDKEIHLANKINNFTVVGIFLVTVINVFISAFGTTAGDVAAVKT